MINLIDIQFLEVLREHDDGVADEKMREMSCQSIVHSAIDQTLLQLLVHNEVWIKIFSP